MDADTQAVADLLADVAAPSARELLALPLAERQDRIARAWAAMDDLRMIQIDQSPLPRQRLLEVLALNWLDVTIRALETGRIEVPALSHDGMASEVSVIVTEPYEAIVQVHDRPGGLSWSILLDVFTLQHRYFKQCVRGIVFPADWTYVRGYASKQQRTLKVWLGLALKHIAELGPDAARWKAAPKTLAILGRPPYWQQMGHQMWNTNSTLLAAIERGPTPDYWDIAARNGIEVLGPVEDVFPELQGHVRRKVERADLAFFEAAREGKTLLFDVVHGVPTRLRVRVRAAMAGDPSIQALYANLPDAFVGDQPIVALGLRLQNRTVPDLLGLYVEVTKALAATGPVTIVLDGMTTDPSGKLYKAYSIQVAETDILEKERAFEAAYRERIAGLPVTVVSAIGRPVRESIYWLGFADAYMAPHGTGNAKYRWIHNTPGLILASSQNVQFGHALRIYEAEGGVEQPSELLYTTPDEVVDLLPADSKYDAAGKLDNYWWLGLLDHNFEIPDPQGLIERFGDLVRRHAADRPRTRDRWRAVLESKKALAPAETGASA